MATAIGVVAGVTRSTSLRTPSSRTANASVPRPVIGALVAAVGWALGLTGIALTAMVLAAALPMGANVFLFSQRYKVAEELITAGIAVSTGLGLVTLSLVMALLS